jgi:hypothetical protein
VYLLQLLGASFESSPRARRHEDVSNVRFMKNQPAEALGQTAVGWLGFAIEGVSSMLIFMRLDLADTEYLRGTRNRPSKS